MALDLKLEIKAKCAKHPRYNPALAGAEGIRGGCDNCLRLLAFFTAGRSLHDDADKLTRVADPHGIFVRVLRWKRASR